MRQLWFVCRPGDKECMDRLYPCASTSGQIQCTMRLPRPRSCHAPKNVKMRKDKALSLEPTYEMSEGSKTLFEPQEQEKYRHVIDMVGPCVSLEFKRRPANSVSRIVTTSPVNPGSPRTTPPPGPGQRKYRISGPRRPSQDILESGNLRKHLDTIGLDPNTPTTEQNTTIRRIRYCRLKHISTGE